MRTFVSHALRVTSVVLVLTSAALAGTGPPMNFPDEMCARYRKLSGYCDEAMTYRGLYNRLPEVVLSPAEKSERCAVSDGRRRESTGSPDGSIVRKLWADHDYTYSRFPDTSSQTPISPEAKAKPFDMGAFLGLAHLGTLCDGKAGQPLYAEVPALSTPELIAYERRYLHQYNGKWFVEHWYVSRTDGLLRQRITASEDANWVTALHIHSVRINEQVSPGDLTYRVWPLERWLRHPDYRHFVQPFAAAFCVAMFALLVMFESERDARLFRTALKHATYTLLVAAGVLLLLALAGFFINPWLVLSYAMLPVAALAGGMAAVVVCAVLLTLSLLVRRPAP